MHERHPAGFSPAELPASVCLFLATAVLAL